jgi:3-hydroxybutyryl-CoA dehydratase
MTATSGDGRLADLPAVGASLPALVRTVTQEKINRYAEASGDHNPIHIDEDYARQTSLGGTVAHGMLVLAYASQAMAAAFGSDWLTGGRLDIRFRAAARPGDCLTVTGKVRAVAPAEAGDADEVTCDLLCANQNGETVLAGLAEVKVRRQ